MFDDDERMRELEERYEGYEVYDRNGEKIGKVDDLLWTRPTAKSTSASRWVSLVFRVLP